MVSITISLGRHMEADSTNPSGRRGRVQHAVLSAPASLPTQGYICAPPRKHETAPRALFVVVQPDARRRR